MISTIEKSKRPKLIMTTTTYLCTNIKYDTDGARVHNLPKKLEFYLSDAMYPRTGVAWEANLEEALADCISEYTGWCVESFKWNILD